jgi:cell division protein FtsA
LRGDEKELGVCLADIGAGSTDLIVYFEGMVAHSGSIPVGGDHFTNDVAVGLRTPLSEAEKIKKTFGHAISRRVQESTEIEVPSVGDRPSRMMSQRLVAEILEPRATELCELVRDHLHHAGVLEICHAGLVLTGGASRLPGFVETGEKILQMPVRLAAASPFSRMPAQLADPEFSAVVGLAMYAHRAIAARISPELGWAAKMRAWLARLGAPGVHWQRH